MGSSTTRSAVWIALLVSLGFSAAGCASEPLSVAQEKQLGAADQQRVRLDNTLLRDRAVVLYVRSLGAELSRAAPPSPYDLRFYVIEDDEIGAFAIAGGAIYVNTGTILKAKNVAEVAGVMSHEIGHVTQRHVVQIYQKAEKVGFFGRMFGFIIGIFTGNPYALNSGDLAIGLGAQTYLATFSRDFEREADRVGVETMIRAGYDPESLAAFFETLMKEEPKGGLPQFLQTHPATPERVTNVRKVIAEAPKPGARRTSDDKFALIQKRIKLIQGMGNDKDDEADDEADDEDDDAGTPPPKAKSKPKSKP